MLKSHLLILCDRQLSTAQVQHMKSQRAALRKAHTSASYFESNDSVEFRAAVVHMNGCRKQPQWMLQKDSIVSNKVVQAMANVPRSATSRKTSPRLQAAALSKMTEEVDAVGLDAAGQILSLVKGIGAGKNVDTSDLCTLNVFWCIPNPSEFSGGDIMASTAAGIYRALRFCQLHARATITFLLASSSSCGSSSVNSSNGAIGVELASSETTFRNIDRWRNALCAGAAVPIADFMPQAVSCWTCIAKSALNTNSMHEVQSLARSQSSLLAGDASCADLEFHITVPDPRFTLERPLCAGDRIEGNFEVRVNELLKRSTGINVWMPV
eukprot:INCI631.2.p1 GENE.INCI631.2~~INCI631.2.p1  ORF type:complete len:325 (-),score=53.94 INCI631.2:1459-2433(-)